MRHSEKLKADRAERVSRAVRLINSGATIKETARILGVAVSKINRYINEYSKNYEAPRIFTDNDINFKEEIKTRNFK